MFFKFLKISNLFLKFFIFILLNFVQVFSADEFPICVIGGGISGINIANLLQDKGYQNVHLFEAKSHFGGKAETYRNSGIILEKGAIFYTAGMKNTLRYMEKYGVKSRPYNAKDQRLFDTDTGANFPSTRSQTPELFEALTRFQDYRRNYLEQDFAPGYVNSNPDLFVPIREWLTERNLTILIPLFVSFITVQGYGDLSDTPALYVLKIMTVEDVFNLYQFGDSWLTTDEGVDMLINKMVQTVRHKSLNSQAVEIQRNRDGSQDLFYKVRNSQVLKKRKCSKTVLAFPPLLSNVVGMIRNLSKEEKRVLSQVKVHKFATSGHIIPTLGRTIYTGIIKQGSDGIPIFSPPEGAGEVVRMVKPGKDTSENVYIAYSWMYGNYDTAPNNQDLRMMKTKIDTFLRKIDANCVTFYLEGFEYFAHVTTESLQKGFYKDFNKIQGNGNVFYATTLSTFEVMNNALEMSEDFVNKYF